MSPRLRALLLTSTALLPLGIGSAVANPLNGQVVGGSATIQSQGSTTTINQQSQSAIINWRTFNIGAGETTRFNQPNSNAVVLNRVTGGLGPSEIYGELVANGRVFLVNRDGILIGRGAVINTGSFLASTNDISNSDFMAARGGRYNFNIPGRPDASIVNLGRITAADGGFAALVAPGVRNSGTITANLGSVGLAAGNGFTLDFYGDKLITLAVGDQVAAAVRDVSTGQTLRSLVQNDGTLRANGGRVELTGAAARHVVNSVINTRGVIEANSVGMRSGQIVLGAATAGSKPAGAPTQTVQVSGTLSAAGKKGSQKGGKIQITGESIEVAGAHIDASGKGGGGKVLIGGDVGGGAARPDLAAVRGAGRESSAVPNATTVTVDAGTVIDVSATRRGDGGKAIVWSDGTTRFAGTIRARGGDLSGNGGFAEVSGHQTLRYAGTVDLRAPKGQAGTLLLDPLNFWITLDGLAPDGGSAMSASAVANHLNNSGDLILSTGASGSQAGDITVASAVSWSTTNTLTLNAHNNIAINAPITATTGGLTLNAPGTITATESVTVGKFTLQNGSWQQVTTDLPGFSASDFRITGGSFLRAAGGNGDSTPYQITDIYGLQGIGASSLLTKSYALPNDIDASGTANWNMGRGFVPIASPGSPFTGSLNGQENTISNLTIAPENADTRSVGLFGSIGSGGAVSNLTLHNVNVTANAGLGAASNQFVGGLAGQNLGTIDNVTVTGFVNGNSLAGVIAGGLVGQNGALGPTPVAGTITNSRAAVNVTVGDGCMGQSCAAGMNAAGGLVGSNVSGSTISYSDNYTSKITINDQLIDIGNVQGGANSFVGGLVGQNGLVGMSGSAAFIDHATAQGNVSSTGVNSSVGGLVGSMGNGSTISDTNATGNVSALAAVGACMQNSSCQFVAAGGLVGQNFGTISESISGTPGIEYDPPTFITVSVGQRGAGGGLVGFNGGTITSSSAYANVLGNAGLGDATDGNQTNIGGLAGTNQGTITYSHAYGTVGAANVANLAAGGLVGDNSGLITYSTASGNVQTGANSAAGGLVAQTGPSDHLCEGCNIGVGYNNTGNISNSTASGNVTVGAASIAGGLAGGASSTLTNVAAAGNVTGGNDSVLGGLVGVLVIGGSINTGGATGAVSSTGANSVIGGLVGVNGGTIELGGAAGAVSGTSSSVVGGLVGTNLGTISNSGTDVEGSSVSAPGAGNLVGGLVGANFGSITNSFANGQVTAGNNGSVGGLVGANATFVNFMPGTIPGSFPAGSITNSMASGEVFGGTNTPAGSLIGNNGASFLNSSGTGSVNGNSIPGSPQVGSASQPSSLPGYPSIVNTCGDTICEIIRTGLLSQGTPDNPGLPPTINPLLDTTNTAQLLVQNPTINDATPPQTPQSMTSQSSQGSQGGQGAQGGQGGQGNKPSGPTGSANPPQIGDPNFTGVPPPGETRFVSNELVFQFSSEVTQETINQLMTEFGLTQLGSQDFGLSGRRLIRVQFGEGRTLRDLIAAIEAKKLPGVITTPNYTFFLAQSADTPGDAAGDPDQYIIEKLRLAEVHRLSRGDNVLVAVIDSGVDGKHPDLDGRIADRLDAGADAKPHVHGTGMAGAIASHKRLLGVAPGARLLAIQAFGTGAGTAQGTTDQILKGLDWAMAKGARIVNMSFAGPRDPMLQEALKKANEKGALLIAAAGNAGPKSPPLFPGADANVIAVTATDMDDKLFTQANRGKYVSIAAPGVDILAPAPDGGYQISTGTSIAAAHVSGVAALLLARRPNANPAAIKEAILSTAKDLGPKGRDEQFGWGLIDPVKAIKALDAKTVGVGGNPQPAASAPPAPPPATARPAQAQPKPRFGSATPPKVARPGAAPGRI